MHVSAIWWIATIALVLAITALDLVLNRGQTHITIRHATRWVIFYVVVALAFGAAVAIGFGPGYGGQFVAGWLTEYSLSADNLFVFLVLMTRFSVPEYLQLRVLTIGILIALVLRGGLIASAPPPSPSSPGCSSSSPRSCSIPPGTWSAPARGARSTTWKRNPRPRWSA